MTGSRAPALLGALAILTLAGCGSQEASTSGPAVASTAAGPGPGIQQTRPQATNPAPAAKPEPPPDPRIPISRLAGQRLMVRMDGVATEPLLRAAREGRIGGVIVFPGPGQADSSVASEIGKLQLAALHAGLPPLLVATDQEGGIVKRFPDGPPSLSAPEIGAEGSIEAAESQGESTGEFLRELGINLDFAPVLDVPAASGSVMTPRAFSSDPQTVTALGSAFAEGLQRAGVGSCGKHFPGLGRALSNTDEKTTVIGGAPGAFAPGLLPYRAAIASGISSVMLSTAVYPGLGGEEPAAWSEAITGGLLRRDLGFTGVEVTDDLASNALRGEIDPARAALRSWRAGVDIALFAHRGAWDSEAVRGLVAAVRAGEVGRPQLRAAYDRIIELKARFARLP